MLILKQLLSFPGPRWTRVETALEAWQFYRFTVFSSCSIEPFIYLFIVDLFSVGTYTCLKFIGCFTSLMFGKVNLAWGGLRARKPAFSLKYISLELEYLARCFIYSTKIVCKSLVYCVCTCCLFFHLQYKPAAKCLHLRYSASFTESRRWQIISCKEDFMKIKLQILLHNEIRVNTQFENTLSNYTKSDISPQIYMCCCL